MAAGAAPSSFTDALASLLTSIAPLKVLPDADPEVLANLEALIVTAVQQGQAAGLQGQVDALGGGAGSSISLPSPSASPDLGGMPGGMPGAMGMGAPGPGRGYSPQPAPPNSDEVRRMLSLG